MTVRVKTKHLMPPSWLTVEMGLEDQTVFVKLSDRWCYISHDDAMLVVNELLTLLGVQAELTRQEDA